MILRDAVYAFKCSETIGFYMFPGVYYEWDSSGQDARIGVDGQKVGGLAGQQAFGTVLTGSRPAPYICLLILPFS
jgi:hypothetical protein